MSQSSAGGRDEATPEGSGIFRRLAPASGSGFVGAFSVIEGLFAPASRAAREEMQRQKKVGARNPSDTDPPSDEETATPPRVVARGRTGTPFSGSVLLRPRECPPVPPRPGSAFALGERAARPLDPMK